MHYDGYKRNPLYTNVIIIAIPIVISLAIIRLYNNACLYNSYVNCGFHDGLTQWVALKLNSTK